MKGTAYLIQSTLIVLWWIGMFVRQGIYDAFQFPGISALAFNAFLLPDLFVIALLSLVRAYKKIENIEYIILGGFAFATLYCINATLLTGGGWLPTLVMSLGLAYNIFLVYKNRFFRASTTNSLALNVAKTVVQIICVWSITLVLIPMLIVRAFGHAFNPAIDNSPFGFALLLLGSLLGLYSAYSMVLKGRGTPLPLDQTQVLVTNGPYKYVRNPMAIAGIGQGIGLSLLIPSFPVFIYALLGALLWHYVVRPIEESDMEQRFGSQYAKYREEVSCWWPRLR